MLRPAAPRDLEAIYDIEIRCFQERRFRLDHVDWILRNDRCLTLVIDEGGRIVAATMLLFEGQTCRVLSVAVIPEARRGGLGRQMMKAVDDIARERGCTRIRLEVSTQNYPAIEFYRTLGYRTDGVLYGYYSWGEDAYSMSLDLLPPARTPAAKSRRDTYR